MRTHKKNNLIPLRRGQISVTPVPKFTHDLPFFYHTKQKHLLDKPIDYEGTDEEGRPIKWKVTPNTHSNFGAPGIEAHEVWIRLLKPKIDEQRTPTGGVKTIVPLGRLRECLRMVGWTEGGWTARRLLKALRQIGGAWCEMDFWIPVPTGEGIQYKHIRGEFSRISLYAIGSKHVSEEDLKQGNVSFDFDLEDTVYVQLHPMEIEIQKDQSQRFLDNQYMFSVGPSARRWYELLAAKIFGVVKNKGRFCEIRYSWYIKHHPTLKKEIQGGAVTRQMNKLIKDHIDLGFIEKVEYRKVKEPDQEVDFIIRYYPGPAAKESISRVLSQIPGKGTHDHIKLVKADEEGSEKEQNKDSDKQSQWTDQELELIRRLNEDFSVTISIAGELVRLHQESVKNQLEAWPFREVKVKNPAGWIVKAIKTNFELPDAYKEDQDNKKQRAINEQRRAAIAACQFCQNSNGYILTDRGARECTHQPEIEQQFDTQK